MAPMSGLAREVMIRSDGKVGGVGVLPMSHVNLQDPEDPLMHRRPERRAAHETGQVTGGRHRGAELV
ncbi:unnamed protein product [Clonostachys solani]|uniref:Uncharacterized protein n=1 Tax=Clonostachys solani TaxID=160281 RepID=A0A9N9ZJR0_9HYPO|nr:unnamed protein product [Clonostachys solani]